MSLLFSRNTQLTASTDNNLIISENEQMLLGITIDSSLSFEEYINNRITLARIACYMDIQKPKTMMK